MSISLLLMFLATFNVSSNAAWLNVVLMSYSPHPKPLLESSLLPLYYCMERKIHILLSWNLKFLPNLKLANRNGHL